MKILLTLIIFALILPVLLSNSQALIPKPTFGGGEYIVKRNYFELTADQQNILLIRLRKKIERLKEKLKKDNKSEKTSATYILNWPLSSSTADYGYHAMKYYVDHNMMYGQLRDYMGGARTYDLPSVPMNHRGTDFFLWPFTWHKMNNNEVQVVAAAPGWILAKDDGYFDKVCGENPPLQNLNWWNAVYLYHEDGSMTWYGHLKSGSLTHKPIDAYVLAGEFLGIVGSAGYSWEPHLHFEIHDEWNTIVDPYIGPVNRNPIITWDTGQQRPYNDSAINKVMTHSSPPDFSVPCPKPAIINDKDNFNPGDSLYVAAYYRDQLAGQQSQYIIYRPDDSVFESWTHSITEEYMFASYWYWGWELPLDAPAGAWKFEVLYESNTYEHTFYVNEIPLLAQIKIFLEGPYNSDTDEMYTILELNGDLPTTAPYSEDPRSISSIPADITDWVLVQLRKSATGPAVVSKSSLLHKNGKIVADDGTSGEISMDGDAGEYYILIRHRNHLPVMSANAISLNGVNSTLYNFTSGEEQFYGFDGSIEIKPNVWGMIAGDTNNDGGVYAEDYTQYRISQGAEGYEISDFNLDGGVYAEDYTIYKINQGLESGIP